MKHLVTISLVFFSLTHLAKAEQKVEGLRILSERYCNRQQATTEDTFLNVVHPDDHQHPAFLTYSQLTLIGILPTVKVTEFKAEKHIVAVLTIRKNAKNNSP